MKPSRSLLSLLLAWMLCFQAVASVSDTQCKHARQPSGFQHVMNGHVMTMASMPQQAHAMHPGHSPGMAMPSRDEAATLKHGVASICACAAGCICAGQCALSCSGGINGQPAVFAFSRLHPAAWADPLAVSAAHGLDLFRPPSIS
jgi:hypothetical protein